MFINQICNHVIANATNNNIELLATVPSLAFNYAFNGNNQDGFNSPKAFPLGEPAIATSSYYSVLYAEYVLRGPFPLGEPVIAKSSRHALRYACQVLKKKFPLGEPVIAAKADDSYYYAIDFGEFPLGESAIATCPFYSQYYAKFVLRRDFYLNGELICKL